jgi:hypothetical protein
MALMIVSLESRRIMTTIIDDYTGGSRSWNQYERAIRAVVEGALEKGLLYPNVVGDQLLYVAAKVMLEHEREHNDGELEKFCDDNIKRIEGWFAGERKLMDQLLEEQRKEDSK